MRNVIILIIAISVIILGGIWEINYLEDTSKYLTTDVMYIKSLLINKDINVAKNSFEDFERDWNNVKDTWMIFVDHDEIQNIDNDIAVLKSYINASNFERSIVYTDSIRNSIDYVIETSKIKIYTVF